MQRSAEVGLVHLRMNQTQHRDIEVEITSSILLFMPPSALCIVSVFQEYMEREIREQDTALFFWGHRNRFENLDL